MIKKDITYTNPITNKEETRAYWFHMNKADIIRIIGRDREGDWEAFIENIAKNGNIDEMLNFIETVVRSSVGYRNANSEFAKSQAFADEFIASEAYGELFVELLNSETAASEFFNGVVGNNINKAQNGAQAANRNQRRKHKK